MIETRSQLRRASVALTPALFGACLSALAAPATPSSAQPPSGEALEQPLLTDHVRLTSPDRFVKAGEAYFSPDGSMLIFQAVPTPEEGAEPSPHYSMYLARLEHNADGRVTGMGDPVRLSNPGSANTCGWFTPDGESVIFGTTLGPPSQPEAPGYQRSGSRYAWQFPENMDIIRLPIPLGERPSGEDAEPMHLIEREGYDAEGSISPDGRFLLYAHAEPTSEGQPDADIWIRDLETGEDHLIVEAAGYDGGPFFSPDARRICYRSDREGNDQLQLFVADLAFNDQGVPTGIEREIRLTDKDHVNWAPYFHPSGELLVYTSSELGHTNYEVVAIELPDRGKADVEPYELARRRVTFAQGFDGLPVFSPDGSHMMWTSQRPAPDERGGRRASGSSQVWIARVAAESGAGEPKSPDAWVGPLAREQAIDLVRAHIGPEEARDRRFEARRVEKAWIVDAFGLGGERTFRVDQLGRVSELMTSDS